MDRSSLTGSGSGEPHPRPGTPPHPFDYPFTTLSASAQSAVWVAEAEAGARAPDRTADSDATAAEPEGGLLALLAVGSNAGHAVMRDKLERQGLDPDFEAEAALCRDLVVGHSAHLSTPGYVPAAPFAVHGRDAPVTVQWLTSAQVRAIDTTEPAYQRRTLDPARHRVRTRQGRVCVSVQLYVSRWGLLGPPHEGPWPLTDQRRLHQLLAGHHDHAVDAAHELAQHHLASRDAATGLPRAELSLPAHHERLRSDVRRRWAGSGWSHDHGLALVALP